MPAMVGGVVGKVWFANIFRLLDAHKGVAHRCFSYRKPLSLLGTSLFTRCFLRRGFRPFLLQWKCWAGKVRPPSVCHVFILHSGPTRRHRAGLRDMYSGDVVGSVVTQTAALVLCLSLGDLNPHI